MTATTDDKIVDLDGLSCRGWRGRTARGTPVVLFTIDDLEGAARLRRTVTIESGEVSTWKGIPCRVWRGEELGIPFVLRVHRIAAEEGRHRELEAELREQPVPVDGHRIAGDVQGPRGISMRHVL